MYVDPNGEFVWVPIVFAAMVGMMQGASAAYNAGATGGNFVAHMLAGATIGAVAAGFSAGAGAAVGAATASMSSFASGAITGAVAGAVGGAVSGIGTAAMTGDANAIWKSALMGMGIGALMGGISNEIASRKPVDILAPGAPPADNTVEIGEGMQFTSKYASDFGIEYLNGGAGGIEEYVVGPIPKGYKQEGDLVYNKDNKRVLGTFAPKSKKYGDMYLYKEAFISKEQLYLTMGHEYLHAAFHYKGYASNEVLEHKSIKHWQYEQAKAWDYNMKTFGAYKDYLMHSNYDYTKFTFTKIRLKVPW